MRNLDLSNYGVNEMNAIEQAENSGGFIALTILGVAYTAGQVAGMFGAALAIGVGIGATAASN